MKRILLMLLIFILIFPTVVSAYDINKSYRKDKEYVLNFVDCIGVDAEENIYLKNEGFRKNAIQVYTNKGKFLYSIRIETKGSYNFIVDDYIWVFVYRAHRVVKYSLDGFLLEETDIDYKEFDKAVGHKIFVKNGITYRIKGALGFFSVWREENGSKERMFNLPIKHIIGNILLILGIVALAMVIINFNLKRWYQNQKSEYSHATVERENYNRQEQSH